MIPARNRTQLHCLLGTLFALALSVAGQTAQTISSPPTPAPPSPVSADPWDPLMETARVARPSGVYKFTDYEVPRDPFIRTKCLAARFCNCTIHGGYNRTFWLNTASAVFRGQLYLAILQRTVSLRTNVTYRLNNKTMRGQVFEANTLLLCKGDTDESNKIHPRDCKLVEPGPGYQEKHPYTERGYWFELNGLIDPRLVSGGDDSGLFLQAGCRPIHLAESKNITKFREGLCMVKVVDGKPPEAPQKLAHRTLTQQGLNNDMTASTGNDMFPQQTSQTDLQTLPSGYPLQGITMNAAEWPVGKLMSLTYSLGMPSWEKSWVPFNYKGTVLWSRHLSPHQVVTVHANGSAVTLYRQENKEVFAPLKPICGNGPRGNTPALLVTQEQSGLPRDVYLGILHYTPRRGPSTVSHERSCHEYLNFFYVMEAEPPFNILEISRPPIPVLAMTNPVLDSPPCNFGMGYISFPTGFVIMNNQVIITYGAGDTQFRVFQASLPDVIGSFSHVWIYKQGLNYTTPTPNAPPSPGLPPAAVTK